MANDISVSDKPIGTIAEAQRLGLQLVNHATCSRQRPGNKGCPYFDVCKFRAIRDRGLTQQDFFNGIGAGPDNIGFYRKVGSNGKVQGHIIPCYDWYYGGNEDRLQQSGRTGDAFTNVVYDGVIRQRIRVETHRLDPDPHCPECKRGNCTLMEDRTISASVLPMVRPSESMQDAVFGNEVEQEMHDAMRRELEQAGLRAMANKPQQGVDDSLGQQLGGGVATLKKKAGA